MAARTNRPETELASHYFEACLPEQFDGYIWFEETHAVTPLPTEAKDGTPGPLEKAVSLHSLGRVSVFKSDQALNYINRPFNKVFGDFPHDCTPERWRVFRSNHP